jgi:hypothetical protein
MGMLSAAALESRRGAHLEASRMFPPTVMPAEGQLPKDRCSMFV